MQLQPDVQVKGKRLGIEGILRPGPGTDSHDDRELPHRFNLATDAPFPLHHRRPAPRRLPRRLVGNMIYPRLSAFICGF